MPRRRTRYTSWLAALGAGLICLVLLAVPLSAGALIPPPGPSSGSSGLQGTVPTPAPSTAPTITTPTNGQSFSRMPITVSGLCLKDLLVKIFANNVFIGSVLCGNGSYTLQVALLDGRNDLVARQFDALDQPSPDSNVVTVTFNNSLFESTGIPILTLTSIYARRGANPGEQLNWPLTISGGTGPYALSVDWGDGKPASLSSQQFPGTVTVTHVYNSPGTYVIIAKATDKNGQIAFLQLVGQANGAVTQSASGKSGSSKGGVQVIIKVIWIPAALCIPLIVIAFWLGRRYELSELRKHLERVE